MVTGLESANLAVRFFLELCALGALGYWGVQAGNGPLAKTGLGLGAPLLRRPYGAHSWRPARR